MTKRLMTRLTTTGEVAKRSGLDIFENLLANLSEGTLKETHLTHRANLDSRLTRKYIETLVKFGLVTKSTSEGSYFIITEKGRDFLEQSMN